MSLRMVLPRFAIALVVEAAVLFALSFYEGVSGDRSFVIGPPNGPTPTPPR